MHITVHMPPRPAADWTDEVAASAKGKPITLPMKNGEVKHQIVGYFLEGRVENGFLVLLADVQDSAPTGTISLEILQKLRERTETIMSARLIPDLRVVTMDIWEGLPR